MLILGATFGLRLIQIDQPIVENYVGRQIPTAMVARNLDRGSGFGRPELDVAPFPNLFLVEPPIYEAAVVLLRRMSGLTLNSSGRAVSAFGITLAAWGLFGLTARRRGDRHALAIIACFAIFPVTIRYGRAFQPDALMLGTILAGLRFWDESETNPSWITLHAAWLLTALGFALKITSAFVLAPLLLVILARRRFSLKIMAMGCLLPAIAWYLHAAGLLGNSETTSGASAENGRIWLNVLIPWALFQGSTYRHLFRFLIVRAFTPIAPLLAVAGFWGGLSEDRLWKVWGLAALATLAMLSAKLHHEYYLLILAPVIAVGLINTLARIGRGGRWGRLVAGILAASFVAGCWLGSASTWKTPREWSGIAEAGREIGEKVGEDRWIVAPEALIYEANRKGCRLEYTSLSARRAAIEWGVEWTGEQPIDLVEFYRARGADYFADLAFDDEPLERRGLHNAVRRRYKIMIDRPGLLLARLTDLEP